MKTMKIHRLHRFAFSVLLHIEPRNHGGQAPLLGGCLVCLYGNLGLASDSVN